MFKNIFCFFLLIIVWSGCGLSDNDAPVPTYIILENPVFDAQNIPGGNTHKITDVWVYADGQLQGIFPLPAKVPVIATGQSSDIVILAGIRKNGVFDSPAFYPFYKSIQKKVVLNPLENIAIPLVFNYTIDSKFELIADFENTNLLTFDLDNDASTNLSLTSESAAAGSKSGKAELTASTATLEIASTETFQKTSLISGNAYIEMDYKGSAQIGVGLITYDDFNPGGLLNYKVVVVPRDNWNKIYVDVTEELSSTRLKSYKLALGFTVPLGRESAEAWIDNVKLVRY